MKNKKFLSEKNNKKEQNFITNVVYFIQNEDSLKGLIVNIRSVKYSFGTNTLSVGYTTLEGKYGTVKEKLLKVSRGLSDYMFSLDLFYKAPLIAYKIEKEDLAVEKVRNIIDKIEKLSNDK